MSFLCRFYRYFIHHGEGEGCLLVRKWGSSAFLRDSTIDVQRARGRDHYTGILSHYFYINFIGVFMQLV